MPEPLKHRFSQDLVRHIADTLKATESSFPVQRFLSLVLPTLEEHELKARSALITSALKETLPSDLQSSTGIIVSSLAPPLEEEHPPADYPDSGLFSWAIMPCADFVAEQGLNSPTLALNTLRELTTRFTAEFAIRPFFIHHQELTLEMVRAWSADENLHVRRLVSEGSRPRLPWGLRLHAFEKDPTPVLALLETLKDDPAEYVRRSVANSLNDISKAHPDRVQSVLAQWRNGAGTDRKRLTKHAARTLVKQGHRGTLAVLGYGPPVISRVTLSTDKSTVAIGSFLNLSAQLVSETQQNLVVDYALSSPGASGRTSRKVFKWKTFKAGPGEKLALSRKVSFRPVTTRTLRPGQHTITLLINGQESGSTSLTLTPPPF